MSNNWSKAVAGIGLFCLSVTGCEPCAGVVTCSSPAHVAVQGTIVDVASGTPLSQVSVSLVRTGGGARDSVGAATDAHGNYQLELPGETGTFDVVVMPMGGAAYRVRDTTLTSSTRNGEAHVLGVWVQSPEFDTSAELFVRSTGILAGYLDVQFTRTGGVEIFGPRLVNGAYEATTDAYGRAPLFEGVYAKGLEDLVGDLYVFGDATGGASVIRGVRLTPSYIFRTSGSVKRLGVGPRLAWIIRIYNRATVASVPGTPVSFRRTSGIPTTTETFSAVTNASGEITVPINPLAQGTVTGDLTITPPNGWAPYTIRGFQLTTFDSETNQFLTQLGVGPHLPWLGIVHGDGKPLANVRVFVQRTGGIATDVQSFYSTSDADGNFDLSAFKPRASGTLIVDLVFDPPPPYVGLTVHNVAVPTIDFDSGRRFLAIWDMFRQ